MSEYQPLPTPIEQQSVALAHVPPPYGGHGDDEDKRGGLNLKRYLLAILRYKWLVLPLVIVGTAAASIASKYMRLKYTSQAMLMIERNQGMMGAGPIQTSQLLPGDAWVDLLRSGRVIDFVVQKHNLVLTHAPQDTTILDGFALDTMYLPGDYTLEVDGAGRSMLLRHNEMNVLETAQVGDSIGRKAGLLWQPPKSELKPNRKVRFTMVPARDASSQLLQKLTTGITKNGIYMRVRYEGDNPRLVAGVVNSLVDRYLYIAAGLKREKLEELSRILEDQLDYAYANLTATERQLRDYQVQTVTLPMAPSQPIAGSETTQSSVVATHFATRISLDGLRREREALENVLARGDSISLEALSVLTVAHQSPELSSAMGELAQKRANLRAFRQMYTDEYIGVQKAMEDLNQVERELIPRLGRQLIVELKKQEDQLEQTISTSAAELEAIPPRAIEEGRLRRAMTSAERLYTDLRQRAENAHLATATTVPDVTVLDRAVVPRRPALDQRMKLVIVGFLGSLGLGLALAILLDRMDPRLRYVEQVTDELGLPVVGAVPNLARSRKLLGSATGGPQVLEALRSIRLGLMHAYGSAGPMMITISSPGSGDGKTFLTSNLGLTFADLGLKTLVIDGDTRRGALHRMFNVDRKPGLTDYLSGAVGADSIICETRFPLVDVIPSGSRRGNAPELLSSQAMGDLLAQIRAQYQVILIDSPPLGAGVDPLVLGALSGNMLLVVRTGITDRTAAESKLRMLDRLPIRLLGTVLNGFAAADTYGYYSYMPGYEPGQEDSQSDVDRLQPA